ncbi:PREDICTED: uncharacterized protein LOC105316099 [Amphimedon queenslandica]|uniref:IgGFc-binding protein N-terminal domain-containing protein n=1 Tax=Amphimedon queenslandica TaxID=400682 RepID=A0A1X7VQA9_AMPQE|nr:PREDICTED: uncharacterized protein LOC105316099 [Amphimedon queenslandica]|eukprot:XP_011409208.1 PREDICTED: uncharacterized protein LOC105316099 [Amphimedon queenslandica]
MAVIGLVLFFITIFVKVTTAQSNVASEFKVGFFRQFSSTSRIDMIILTESISPVQFSISSLNGSIHNGTTTRDTPAIVTLPSTLQVRETTYDYRQLGLLVTSPPDKPISVVLVGWTIDPRSTYLALPCIEYIEHQPDQEYIYYGISNDHKKANTPLSDYYSQILLVGCRGNTTVTITPTHDVQLPDNPQSSTSSTINVAAGSSHTITLHSLQTLLIGAPNVDLSGTKIVSNYPLTVVGGHDCTRVQGDTVACDPISTQIPPTINWGTQFLLTPLYDLAAGQQFKVLASDDDTELNVTCDNYSINEYLENEGNFTTINIESGKFCTLVCSEPCYVAELAFSRHYFPDFNGDPLLMTVPPISQYPHSVTFTTLPDVPTNFYSIAVPADSYFDCDIIINGVLTTLNWTPIRDTNGVITGYGYNTTASGSYTIAHSNPNGRIYVNAYGFDKFGGYGYITGTLLQQYDNDSHFVLSARLYTPSSFNCSTVERTTTPTGNEINGAKIPLIISGGAITIAICVVCAITFGILVIHRKYHKTDSVQEPIYDTITDGPIYIQILPSKPKPRPGHQI